jgi:hypothetical protein
MKLGIFTKNKGAMSFNFLVAVVALSFLYYLADAFKFSMPYGYDEVITIWPIGRILSESNLQDFPRILMASFLGEDHLFPVTNFLAYLIYSNKFDPIITISIATKMLYVAWLVSVSILIKLLYSNKIKTVLAMGLIISNQALVFYNSTYNIGFNLVILFSVLGMYYITKYILIRKSRYLLYTYLVFLLGTFSFENFFATYSLVTLFAIYKIYLLNESISYKLLTLIKIAVILCMTLLPYLLIHYYQYGTILPGSRLDIINEGDLLKNSLIVLVRIINDWLYGIPQYSFFNFSKALVILLPIGLFLFFIRKKINLFKNQNSNALIFASTLTLPVCMFTGRYFPGLWTFIGIILIIALSDIIINTIDNFLLSDTKKNYWLSALILLLLFLNFTIQPFQRMSSIYKDVHETSIAAFNVINSATNQLTIVKLPDAEDLPHPVAFWIGNQIYNRNSGLSYFKKYNVLRMNEMYIEAYKNPENKKFAFFENLLNNRINNSFTLFKNRNTFFTLDRDGSNNTIFRASSLPKSSNALYDIYLPQFIKNTSLKNNLTVELLLGQKVSSLDKLTYGEKPILDFKIDGNKLSFVTDDMKSPNQVSMISGVTNKYIPFKTIKIFSTIPVMNNIVTTPSKNANFPLVSTNLTACNFELKSPNVDIYLSIPSSTTLPIDTLQPISKIWTNLLMTYWSFDQHKDHRLLKVKVKFEGNAGAINHCI